MAGDVLFRSELAVQEPFGLYQQQYEQVAAVLVKLRVEEHLHDCCHRRKGQIWLACAYSSTMQHPAWATG